MRKRKANISRVRLTDLILSLLLVAFAIALLNLIVMNANLWRQKQGLVLQNLEFQEQIEKEGEKYFELEKLRFINDYYAERFPEAARTLDIVYTVSKRENFDPILAAKIIKTESNFNQFAVSKAGALGLMQVMYGVWRKELNIDFSKIFEREYNIQTGIRAFKKILEESDGNFLLALQRYNSGYIKVENKYVQSVLTGKKPEEIR